MKKETLKLKTILVCIGLLLCFSQQAEAQFFKKLKKRAEEAAKEAVLRKAEEKAAQTAEKGMDKIFDFDLSKKSMDPSVLPASYDFEWKYKLKMKSKQGDFDMAYYLKPGANYFGSKPEFKEKMMMNGMFMVMDQGLKTMTIFMNTNGKKSGHVVPMMTDEVVSDADDTELMSNMNYKELGTKTILGYECQGFQIENSEIKMIMYVTFDAPVSFNQVYGGTNSKALPKGFDPKWLKGADNSLMMEMTFMNKKKKKFNATMTCVELVEKAHTIEVSEYEFMKLTTQPAEGDY
jgi:hypothetical protein